MTKTKLENFINSSKMPIANRRTLVYLMRHLKRFLLNHDSLDRIAADEKIKMTVEDLSFQFRYVFDLDSHESGSYY
jgi:hypothetical protein